jgi:hypothetical protein
MLSQSCSVFLIRGHRSWNRSKSRTGEVGAPSRDHDRGVPCHYRGSLRQRHLSSHSRRQDGTCRSPRRTIPEAERDTSATKLWATVPLTSFCPVQPLDVVSSADAAFGVTDHIDPLTPVIVSQLLDPLGDHSGDVLDRPRVVTAEYAAEVDAMHAVSPPSLPSRTRPSSRRRRASRLASCRRCGAPERAAGLGWAAWARTAVSFLHSLADEEEFLSSLDQRGIWSVEAERVEARADRLAERRPEIRVRSSWSSAAKSAA